MPVINNIFYTQTKGQFPPLVLIHGAASSHLGWPVELRRFPERAVITPDLPGHGKSLPSGYNRIADYAEAVVTLLDGLEVSQVIFVGHSMGGAIAQHLAVHHADRTAGIVLIGTGSTLPVTSKILDDVQSNPEKVAERITRWAWASNAPEKMRQLGHQQILETDPAVVYGDFVACNQFDLRDSLSTVQVPALVIKGTADRMTPVELAQDLIDRLTHVTARILTDAGHMMHLEQPAVIASYITTWLKENNL